jgi:hypothetical protein
MSQLYQRRYLAAPYNRARELLQEFVEGSESTGLLRLTLPLENIEGGGLSKNVDITFQPGADPMHFDKPWSVQWHPDGGGPYPTFAGTLTIRADESYETSVLELQGSYKPPLGAAGLLFDTVLGSRIAHATARKLLQDLGANIEDRYRTSEADKTAPSGHD